VASPRHIASEGGAARKALAFVKAPGLPVPRRRVARHCAGGFTLIELIVVLALAALLIGVVPPLIGAAFPGVQLKAAARSTAAGLRLAREEAIRGGRDVAFLLDVEGRRYQVEGDSRAISFPSGLDLKLEGARSEMRDDQVGGVRFYPDGSSTGGRVLISRGGHGYQVGVTWLTGRIAIGPWDGD
jgi:general secretion pathway protein H